MKSERNHKEAREWTLSVLSIIEKYGADPDCKLNDTESQELIKALRVLRKEVQEGKYSVTFLGAFTVGKSTMINAFLGDEYLPNTIEVCTAELTRIRSSDSTTIRLDLRKRPSEKEIEAFRKASGSLTTKLEKSTNSSHRLSIVPSDSAPSSLRKVLSAMCTAQGEEDHPELGPLRENILDVDLRFPCPSIPDDVEFIDTPGVHSIHETHERIAHSIIPRSQLVIVMIHPDTAGNIYDLKFIERIVKYRNRKVFYIINKADLLQEDEIDPKGGRGPAKGLMESLKGRDDNPEIFFVSAQYALAAQQVTKGTVKPDRIEQDARIIGGKKLFEKAEEGAQALAEYLMERSRFPMLRTRIIDYLFNENKDKAIVESACGFIGETASNFADTINLELALAKDPDEIEKLKRDRVQNETRLSAIRDRSRQVLANYHLEALGGKDQYTGKVYSGFEREVDLLFKEANVEREVVRPLAEWLEIESNLDKVKSAKNVGFRPLRLELDQITERFASQAMARVNEIVGTAENRAVDQIADLIDRLAELKMGAIERVDIGKLVRMVDLKGIPEPPTANWDDWAQGLVMMGRRVISRIKQWFMTDQEWKKLLEDSVRTAAFQVLVNVSEIQGRNVDPVRNKIKANVKERIDAFERQLKRKFDETANKLQREIASVLEREDEIRSNRQAIVQRLEPKAKELAGVAKKARDLLADRHAPNVKER